MKPAEAQEIIVQRWKADWGTTTPYTLDNETNKLDKGTVPWARFSIAMLPGDKPTLGPIGSRKFWRHGQVRVQVFTKSNTGAKRGLQLATQARDIFEGNNVSDVHFHSGEVRLSTDDGLWLMTIAEIDFGYDEEK